MSHGQDPPGAGSDRAEPPRYSLEGQSALVSDGFAAPVPDLPPEDAPPPYGEMHDQLQFSQSGFEAGANVTQDGRVNININQKNGRLAELLGATLRNQAPIVEEQGPSPPAYIPPSLGGLPGQTPPPRLNVVIQIVGSRGDVQPFVALGKVLKATYGHRVRIATHATFQKFVEDNGLEFFCIGGDPSELMAFMVKNPGLMPGFDALKTGEVSKRRRGMEEILLGCWRSCIEPGNGLGPRLPPHRKGQHVNLDEGATLPGDPSERPFIADAIIANPPSFAHIHVAEKLGIPLHLMFTMPWSPTRSFPHPLADIMSSNTDDVMTNYLSYTLVEMMTWQGLGDVINRFRERVLELEPLSLFYAPGLLTRLRIPYTYCWSPSLIPKPNDWQSNVDISGFFFLDLATSYTPEPELAAFLEAGPPPVYIGFGSIVVDDPNALTRLIFDAIHLSGIRAIVSQGWGGLGADDVGIPPGVFMVGNCPHDWLFQRVSCVVHHGGAGTMAAGVRAGKPTVIVPFFGDQPFWGAMIERAGAGPAPIPYKDINAEKLAQAITQALKPQTLEQAQSLGRKIGEERGSDMGGKSFHDHLDLSSLRCALVPSRAAVWRVRRTKVRLSAFAATVLVSLQVLSYSDLKMWRPQEYNTDGQPWDPISAVGASLVTDISTIAMAVADFPRGMFQGPKKDPKQKDSKSSKDSESHGASSGRPSDLPSTTHGGNESRTTLQTVGSSSTAQESADSGAGAVELPATEVGTPPVPTEREPVTPGSAELPPDADSALAVAPSLTVTSDESHEPERVSTIDSLATQRSSDNLSQEPSAGPSQSSHSRTPSHSRAGSHSRTPSHSRAGSHSQTPSNTENPYQNFNLDDLRGAGMSVRKIVTTGMKSPMNFCLNLAKGFRNVPRLYNDDTVRPPEKVTDMTSGLKVAGREFGFGIYDGISGLVTQPLRGAQKEGGVGLVKGFGRGVGGAFTKPFGALVSLPAYSVQGAYMSLRNRFSKSVDNYIAASRVIQGGEEFDAATPEEREAVLAQWNRAKFDLRNFYALKLKEAKDGKEKERSPAHPASAEAPSSAEAPALRTGIAELLAPHSGDSGTSRLGLKAKDSWKRSHVDVKVPPRNQDEEFEHAIQASVRETSRGDAGEDARVERAIRQSVRSVRNLHTGGQPASTSDTGIPSVAELEGSTADADLQITDEEYQELVEKAIQQSMVTDEKAPPREDDEDLKRVLERSKTDMSAPEEERDEELRRAIEASRAAPGPADEDEELRKAIEASEREGREEKDRERREKTEEDIVLEYVMKQSLQEEEYRKAMREGVGPLAGARKLEEPDEEVEGTGKGKEKGREVDSDEEELRRAVEMSMKVDEEHDGPGAGTSAEGPAPGKES